MGAVSHVKSNTIGDATGTVTFWNGATTSSAAATNLVRPGDWNSAHNFYQTITGNTGGDASTASGTNLVIGGTNQATVRLSTAAGAATLWVDGPTPYTALTYQNRQLGASTTTSAGQNSLWLVPVRLVAPVSGSTMQVMISLSGTITSAATAQQGQTHQFAIYSQNATNTSRFDTWWTGARSITLWNSGTSSYSYNYGGTTSSSAGSNLGTAQVMGMRLFNIPINSTITPGLYLLGYLCSTSTAGYSAAMSRVALLMDNPVTVGMGTFGQATAGSIGYVDAGTFNTTTGALPASVGLSQIAQVTNLVPYFKIGAI
jgi:hypothetical protein